MLNVFPFRAVLLYVSVLISGNLYSQVWEVGGMVGASNYTGDLARKVVFSETGFSAGVMGRYNLSKHFAIRQSITYLRISGHDSNFNEYVTRNLSFSSHVWELGNMIEFNFRSFGVEKTRERQTFFVFTGINVFHFNPRARLNGAYVNLQPLGTEGQNLEGGKRYKKIGLAIPLGMGYKYSMTPNFILGVELGFRKTFTDYLDDVSSEYPDLVLVEAKSGVIAAHLSDRSREKDPFLPQSAYKDMRGNPNLKDWYIIAGVTLTYRFTPIPCAFY